MLYIHLTHGRQTFKFALKNKLHQLQVMHFHYLFLWCNDTRSNSSKCNLSCDAYSSLCCLHKLSINRYCMNNIVYFSDQSLKHHWKKICSEKANAWKANIPLAVFTKYVYMLYYVHHRCQISFLLSMWLFFIYKIYKNSILYYTLYIMYTENYVWNYVLLSLHKHI